MFESENTMSKSVPLQLQIRSVTVTLFGLDLEFQHWDLLMQLKLRRFIVFYTIRAESGRKTFWD
jgi:hypothetical protein